MRKDGDGMNAIVLCFCKWERSASSWVSCIFDWWSLYSPLPPQAVPSTLGLAVKHAGWGLNGYVATQQMLPQAFSPMLLVPDTCCLMTTLGLHQWRLRHRIVWLKFSRIRQCSVIFGDFYLSCMDDNRNTNLLSKAAIFADILYLYESGNLHHRISWNQYISK